MKSSAGIKPPVPPKCRACGASQPHAVLRRPGEPKYGHDWLCGSCELLRVDPDAKLGAMPGLPITGRKAPLQKETLFDVQP